MAGTAGFAAPMATMSTSTRLLLRKNGISSASELSADAPSVLAKKLGVSPLEALRIQEELGLRPVPQQTTALDLLELNAQHGQHIFTQCRDLDKLLGGGFSRGQVTEICGGPGSGKTQVCMQACISAWLPEDMGGPGGQSVYLDTEGSFSTRRALQMANALADFVCRRYPDRPPVTGEDILSSVHVARAHDAESLLAFARNLRDFLAENPRIVIVVIDSVAFHFRYDVADMSKRTRTLTRLAQTLNSVASAFNAAVLVTNHMTTRPADGVLAPTLGESWSHAITSRVLITPTDDWVEGDDSGPVRIREAELLKSPSQTLDTCSFVVLSKGVRKVPASLSGAKRIRSEE